MRRTRRRPVGGTGPGGAAAVMARTLPVAWMRLPGAGAAGASAAMATLSTSLPLDSAFVGPLRRRAVAHDLPVDQVDHVLGDVGGVVGDPLQVADGREHRQAGVDQPRRLFHVI